MRRSTKLQIEVLESRQLFAADLLSAQAGGVAQLTDDGGFIEPFDAFRPSGTTLFDAPDTYGNNRLTATAGNESLLRS